MSDLTQRLSQLTPEKRALLEKRLKEKAEGKKPDEPEPLAIVGMSCRFPGGANSPEVFWQLLKNGVDAVAEVPRERWDIDAYYDPDPEAPKKMSTRWGGFLKGIEQFDPHFFNLSPREATQMDPQQRMLLETAWEALEAAGQTLEGLRGSATGVFVGIHSYSSDYGWMQMSDLESLSIYTATGTNHSIMPNRISYWLDLRGPSMALDTACSSSLVAVHLACQSLRARECRMALAGGANLLLSPEPTVAFSKMNMMAADGRCKVFDARADGFVRSEGVGLVVIKRLAEALADGDPILALIRGSAVNQDGATNGITAPNSLSQIDVVRAALQNAGVQPEEITFVETHGTGTILGDPIEVEALTAAIGQPRPNGPACVLGSTKTNIGHLEGAAGVAGLIKTVLCLQHGEIPPHLHFTKLNPHLSLANTPFEIHPNGCAWPSGAEKRIAGVSSFGFGGTNAHVILQGADETQGAKKDKEGKEPNVIATCRLLPLSARSPEALHTLAQSYQKFLSHAPCSVHDLGYTASARRTHHEYRLALVARSLEEAEQKLENFFEEEESASVITASCKPSDRQPGLAFVFSGQGPNWFGIGRELLQQEKTFREQMTRCDEILRELAGWSLLEELRRDENTSRLEDAEFAQPAYCAVQISLAALWQSWGIVPEAVIGHSVGEIAAAHVAGALTLEEALCVVYHRGRLLQQATGSGKMAAVALPAEEAQKWLAGYENRVAIASLNSPNAVVLSGEAEALAEISQALQQRETSCRMLNVKFASHSPQMEPYRVALAQALQGLQPRATSIPMISTVTAEAIRGESLNAEYWGRNVRATVRFSEALEKLLAEEYGAFVEISPHPVIANAIAQNARLRNKEAIAVSSLRRGQDERMTMLTALAALYVNGYAVNWSALYPSGKVVELPSYPWQKKRYWIEERKARGEGRWVSGEARPHHSSPFASRHPLLGVRLQSPLPIFETQLSFALQPFLADHRVAGAGIVPAAVYLEMLLAASKEVFGEGAHAVQEMTIHETLALPEAAEATLQVILTARDADSYAFQIFSAAREHEEKLQWRLQASGVIANEKSPHAASSFSPKDFQQRCAKHVPGNNFYEKVHAHGFQFGEKFQGLTRLWVDQEEALAEIQLPEALRAEASSFHIHPALLDACMQTLAALLPMNGPQADPVLMVNLGSFRLHRAPSHKLWSHVIVRPENEAYHGQVKIYNETGELVASAENLLLKRIRRALLQCAANETESDWLYEVEWQPKPRALRDAAQEIAPAPLLPNEIIASLQPGAADLSAQHGLENFRALLPHLESLSLAYAQHALHQLGCDFKIGDYFTLEAFAEYFGVASRHARLLLRMFEMLVEEGVLVKVCNDETSASNTPLPSLEGGIAGGYRAITNAIAPTADELRQRQRELLQRFPRCEAELILLGRCGEKLAEVLQDKCDPLQILFPAEDPASAEKLYRDSAFGKTANVLMGEAIAAALANWPKERKLRTLEIGAGTGGTTAFVLPKLPGARIEYVFTDVSRLLLAEAEQKFRDYPFLRYQLLDVEKDSAAQGFSGQQFDLILASNVLHATTDLRQTLQQVKKLLAPTGLLALLEGTSSQRWIDLIFGMTEGWWRFSDYELRPSHPLLSSQQWLGLLQQSGFEHAAALGDDEGGLEKQAIILARNSAAQTSSAWLLFVDEDGFGAALAKQITARGERAIQVSAGRDFEKVDEQSFKLDPTKPEDFVRLLNEVQVPLTSIIHLWGLKASPMFDLHTSSIPPLRGARGVLTASSIANDNSVDKTLTHDAMNLSEAVTRDGTPLTPLKGGMMRVTTFDQAALAQLEVEQAMSCGSVLHRVQALTRAQNASTPKLWLITKNAQPIGAATQPLAATQSPLWGMGRVLALEHPELWGGAIDLEEGVEAEAAAQKLWQEISQADEEDQIALRGEERFVARLVRRPKIVDSSSWIVDREPRSTIHDPQSTIHDSRSSILITGGLGSLGLVLAKWFAEQGARHLVLLGRRGLPERAQWASLSPESEAYQRVEAVRAIEAFGVTVTPFAADVSDMAQMSALFEQFGDTLPPLRGLVHAAAIIDFQKLDEMSLAHLLATLRPKLAGTWVLHELTKQMPLDFFVLFSSTTALFGSHGLAHYAAANQFLDGFAHYRAALGLPALSINWGLWERMGRFSIAEQNEVLRFGLIPMPAAKALAEFGKILGEAELAHKETSRLQQSWGASPTSRMPQITIADIDWSKLKPAYEARKRRPFFDAIAIKPKAEEKKPAKAKLDILKQLQQTPEDDRHEVLLGFIQAQAAKVLGLATPRELDPERGFFEMGMDSLTSVELRRRLETSFEEQLPSTLTFNYPNVAALTNYIAARVLRWELEPVKSDLRTRGLEATNTTERKTGFTSKDDYSEEELVALLAEKLQQA